MTSVSDAVQQELMAQFDREDYWDDWRMIAVFDSNRKADCAKRRDQELRAVAAGAKARHATEAERRRLKTSLTEDGDLRVPQAKHLQAAVKEEVESAKKATLEFVEGGGIQAGLSKFMMNPIPSTLR